MKQEYKCKQCGALLMNTASYAVCSEGCGGLKPKMPRDVEQLNHAKILGLPEAAKSHHESFWMIDGQRYRRTKKYAGKLDKKPKAVAREVVAISDGGVYRFEKCVETDVA